MRSFHDIRFEPALGRDLECTVQFKTDVVRTKPGAEYRNGLLGQPRHGYRWSVARATTEMEDVREFHAARKGHRHSFRFQDPFDHVLPLTVLSTGSTSETDFDIVKRYVAGGTTFERRILLPDTSQTTVYVNSTALASSAWSITTDYKLRLAAAPGAGNPVAVEGVFDVPCRFDAELGSRIASPEAEQVTVELTEARYSPPVTLSTSSTWSARACNVFDSTQYFFDGFGRTTLSTMWQPCHTDTWADPMATVPIKLGASDIDYSISGGYFSAGTAIAAGERKYLYLCLQKALHPPVRVRQHLRFRSATDIAYRIYTQYGLQLTTRASTGFVSTSLVEPRINWEPSFAVVIESSPLGPGAAILSMPVGGAQYDGFFEVDFYSTYIKATFYPSTGGSAGIETTVTPYSTAEDWYLSVRMFEFHYNDLDWIEVRSL